MNINSQILDTIDFLKQDPLDVFRSQKAIEQVPDQTYSSWQIREVSQGFESLIEFPYITHVYLMDCRKLQSLAWLSSFPNLEFLWIYGSDKLSSLEGIQATKNLKSLTISPSFNGNITLDSLSPLADLSRLQDFTFHGKTRDGALSYLNFLKELKIADFSNKYAWDEIARFEASHPLTDFRWKGGIVFDALPNILKCKKCDTPQAMLTGKGLKLACPNCDGAYIDKHMERYRKTSEGQLHQKIVQILD